MGPTGSAGDGRRFLPAGTVANSALPPAERLSWMVELLPFIEQEKLSATIDRKAGWDAEGHSAAVRTLVKIYRCADWVREAQEPAGHLTSYVGSAGLGADATELPAGDRNAGVFGHDRRTNLNDVPDGTSNTLMIWETARDNGPWAQGGLATLRGLDPGDG